MSHPISLTLSDDLKRNRLTVFFRLILAIPHFIWLGLWGIAVLVALVVSWFATLIMGRTPAGLHNFIAQYLRYSTQVNGYLYLLADPYPGFLGNRDYPVDLVVAPAAPQNRWKTFFRGLLALPVVIMNQALSYTLIAIWVLGWFVCMFTGAMPRGMRDLGALAVRFGVQANGYMFLLTDRYPSFSPSPTE
jgi:hypothetical protein